MRQLNSGLRYTVKLCKAWRATGSGDNSKHQNTAEGDSMLIGGAMQSGTHHVLWGRRQIRRKETPYTAAAAGGGRSRGMCWGVMCIDAGVSVMDVLEAGVVQNGWGCGYEDRAQQAPNEAQHSVFLLSLLNNTTHEATCLPHTDNGFWED